MDLARHELLFSKDRVSSYRKACQNDEVKATLLYKYNIELSQALYPLISILEVGLRNGIDRELRKRFQDQDWLINHRNQFANHPDLTYKDGQGNILPDYFFIEKLKRAEEKLTFRKVPITQGRLMAELTFGFWVKFFDTSPIKILQGAPTQAFVNKPSMKLGLVHSHLNSIVTLRNRISHSEPICFNQSRKLCLDTIQKYERNIVDALGWLDNDLKEWSNEMNNFSAVFGKISTLGIS